MTNKLDLNIQKILQDWSISDALRELIANAYDEAKLSNTSEPKISYDDVNKKVTIQDFGRGLKQEHFTQNESKEKNESSSAVGKFGIGLKDAISVLNRNSKKIIFKTSHNTFWPILDYKVGATDKIQTLHMEYNNETIPVGTTIIIDEIKKSDYDEAIINFLQNTNLKKIASSKKGEIYIDHDCPTIFYNGMKISNDENFIFSYNILEENKKLRKSLNRERKMISRDAYRDVIISILKSCINKDNQDLIDLILKNRDKNNNEWSFIEIKKLVFQNSNQKLLAVCSELLTNRVYLDYARHNSYVPIYVNKSEYESICRDESTKEFSIDKFGYDYVNSYQVEEISYDKLTQKEKDNWSWVMQKIKELSKVWMGWKTYFINTKIYIIKDHPNAIGISSAGKIEIVRKILIHKSDLFNTLIHEICHTVSKASDASILFEDTLTEAFYYVLLLKE